jgi:Protein of unknown function (DUF2806)
MPDSDELPTIGQVISNWLGVQLPAIPMPQTIKNFDKAVGKLLLAAGENVEARIKNNTAKTKARGKIDVEGMYRTEEEKRKIENRALTTKAALEDLRANPGQEDAHAEIDDDWLNFFARLAEDKSSEELQILFGRILAGEVKRPGSFSLRTMETMATISKSDAERLSKLLSFSFGERLIPFQRTENGDPSEDDKLFLSELGIAVYASQIGGLQLKLSVPPTTTGLYKASHYAIAVVNQMSEPANFSVPGQPLTSTGRQLISIASSPPTDIEFLKKVAQQIMDDLRSRYSAQIANGLLKVHVATTTPLDGDRVTYNSVFTVEK